MKLRRLFALLTSGTMLHLSVVAGDAACATHGASGLHAAKTSGAHRMVAHHPMPMAVRASASAPTVLPVAKAGVPPCEVPAQQHCCDALLGCSVDSAAATGPEVLAGAIIPATQAHVAPDDIPASFAPAPEPPPPKA